MLPGRERDNFLEQTAEIGVAVVIGVGVVEVVREADRA